MYTFSIVIQSDYKPKSAWSTTQVGSSWIAAMGKAMREFQRTVAKGVKGNREWRIRVTKVVLD